MKAEDEEMLRLAITLLSLLLISLHFYIPEAFTVIVTKTYSMMLAPSQTIRSKNKKRKGSTNLKSLPSKHDKDASNGSKDVSARISLPLAEVPISAMENIVREPSTKRNNEKSDNGKTLEKPTNANNTAETVSKHKRKPRPKKQITRTDPEASKKNKVVQFPSTGNLPDFFWRSIDMDQLRCHPKFKPLPLPNNITDLNTLEDVRYFRQDSRQWDDLHHGRCTTSQAAGALGFLEPMAGQTLKIAPAWQRGGRGSYFRLSQKPLRTLDEMKKKLLDSSIPDESTKNETQIEDLWLEGESENGHVASFTYKVPKLTMERRSAYIKGLARQGDQLDRTIKMKWGNTQEATSILTAINYFANNSDLAYVQEIGMCGAGLQLNNTITGSSLLVGASPDAVIVYKDGSMEALEVKNHCPFFSNLNRKRHGGKVKRFSISNFPLDESGGVFPQYVPQLQMEMLCLGPQCKSAVMIRQTALQGALVLRMKRDDAWIEEMLYWLHQFQTEYVEQHKPPPVNFFWNNTQSVELQSRYRNFVNDTARLRNTVSVVARIPNSDIQRVEEAMPMFLDSI